MAKKCELNTILDTSFLYTKEAQQSEIEWNGWTSKTQQLCMKWRGMGRDMMHYKVYCVDSALTKLVLLNWPFENKITLMCLK